MKSVSDNAKSQDKVALPTRRTLENGPQERIHESRNWSKADVWRLEWPPESGQFVVVKDMKKRPLWFRCLAGRYFLAREWRALQALKSVSGVPRAVARPDNDCIVMEWKTGTPVLSLVRGEVSGRALENLARLIAQSHAQGVTHGDLHRSNVLIGPNDDVTILDWATASVFRTHRARWTQREWVALDNRAVAKMKLYYAPHLLEESERELLAGGGSFLYRAVRNLRYLGERLRGKKTTLPASKQADYRRRLEKTPPPKQP